MNFPFRVLGILLISTAAQAKPMHFNQILQEVINHYPSLRTAQMQVEKSLHATVRVQSQLSWQLATQGGYAKDVSFFGSGVERLDLGANLSRKILSGGIFSINADMRREDADETLSPFLANPSTNTSISLNFRKPLQRNAGNLEYNLELKQAKLSVVLASAARQTAYDQIAAQLNELYLSALITRSRIENINQSVKRTVRLRKYIDSRFNLGIAEDKDQLQVIAQYNSQLAQLKTLETAWVQQRIALNRLMARAWDADVELYSMDKEQDKPAGELQDFIREAKQYSPAMLSLRAELELVDNEIRRRREDKKDNLDLVAYVGNHNLSGDIQASGGGVSSEDSNEVIGGIRLEYQHGLDKSGQDAALAQAQLDRSINLQNQQQIMEDLQYDVASLISELQAVLASLAAYRLSVESEQAKLKEADQRYRKGRIDVDNVIQFESQLAAAELALVLQRIELARRLFRLDLLRGQVWKAIDLPEQTMQTNKLTELE